MQIGINHFGHFYLTYQLWDLVKKSLSPRIVNLSSYGHQLVGYNHKIDFDGIFYENGGYEKWLAYSTSKLANIMFTKELQRRMDEARIHGLAMSVHPGFVRIELVRDLKNDSLLWKIMAKVFLPLQHLIHKSPK